MWGLLGPLRRLVARAHAWRGELAQAAPGLPASLDRWSLRAMFAALAAWSACLWVIGTEAMGSCWAASVQLAAAELAALAVALTVPNYVVKLVFLLSPRPSSPAARLAAAEEERTVLRRSRHGRALLRMLALAAAACCVGGLVTTAAICWSPGIMAAAGRSFILPSWAWSAVRLGWAWLAMLPLALASAALALTASLLHRYGPSDPHRLVVRDIMWSSATGLAVAAGLWYAGMNLLGLALVCSMVMIAFAIATAARLAPGIKSVRLSGSASPVRWRERWLNVGEWAALAWVVTLQCRALREAAGVGWAATWLWVAATAVVFAWHARRLDRRPRPARALEAAAAGAGAILLAVLQVALLVVAAAGAGGGAWHWVWISLAAAGQFPFAALAAVTLARRRRLFAGAGFAGRLWMAGAAGGAAVGCLAAVAMLSSVGGPMLLALTVLALVAGVTLVVGGRLSSELSRRSDKRAWRGGIRWAAAGGVSILALTLVCAGLSRTVQAGLGAGGRVAVGPSWTVVRRGDGSVAVLSPAGPLHRRPDLTDLAHKIMRASPGRWWMVLTDCSDPPDGVGRAVPPNMRLQVSYIDGLAARLAAPPAGLEDRGAFSRALFTHPGGLDGMYLTAPPLDHPDGWCVYSRQVLARCVDMLGWDGVLLVRVSARRADVARLLAAVETFQWAARAASRGVPPRPRAYSTYAAVAADEKEAEVLLVACFGASRSARRIRRALDSAAKQTHLTVLSSAELTDSLSLLPVSRHVPGRWPAPRVIPSEDLWRGFLRKLRNPVR